MSYTLSHLREVLREDYLSSFHVLKNGGSINGNPVINHGYEGDGTGDSVKTKIPWANVGKAFTIHFEIKSIDSFSSKAVFGTSSGANGPMLRIASSTSAIFWNDTAATSKNLSFSALTAPFTGTLTYDDSTQEGSFYINGLLDETFTMGQVGNFGEFLELGGRLNGGSDSFDGNIPLFRVFSGVATAQEVLRLHDNSTFKYRNDGVARWPLNDKIGTSSFITTDVLNGINLTLGDGITTSLFPTKLSGRNGFSFDGADSLRAADDERLRITGAISIGMWVRGFLPGANSALLTKNINNSVLTNNTDTVYEISYLNADGNIYFQFGNGTLKKNITITGSDVLNGQENLIVFTWDGTTSANGVKAYLNGRLVAEATSTISSIQAAATALWIGDSTTTTGYTGDMYDIHLKDYALNATQIRDMYLKGPKYLGNL